jgi:hypothetical protein
MNIMVREILIGLFIISVSLFTSCKISNKTIESNTVSTADAENTLFSFESLPLSTKADFFSKKTGPHVLADPDYYVWCLTVIKWNDGKYHGYYSRWPKELGHNGWLVDCEIAHAVSETPEGPFRFVNVVLESRNTNGWDVINAHNPAVCVADGKIHLYYIANELKGKLDDLSSPMDVKFREKNWKLIRNSQRIGVATATDPAGVFTRTPNPIVEPDNVLFKNIAVNPAVCYANGIFTMIMKGDDVGKESWFRIQLAGHSKSAEGPFVFQQKPVYDKMQTEDAGIWHDKRTETYYMTCHVMEQPDLALFSSKDSYKWQEASQPIFMKKEFVMDNGEIWKPERVERPFVLTDDKGKAVMLYVAIADKGVNGNIAIPIKQK